MRRSEVLVISRKTPWALLNLIPTICRIPAAAIQLTSAPMTPTEMPWVLRIVLTFLWRIIGKIVAAVAARSSPTSILISLRKWKLMTQKAGRLTARTIGTASKAIAKGTIMQGMMMTMMMAAEVMVVVRAVRVEAVKLLRVDQEPLGQERGCILFLRQCPFHQGPH
jgi:hypothetical protein